MGTSGRGGWELVGGGGWLWVRVYFSECGWARVDAGGKGCVRLGIGDLGCLGEVVYLLLDTNSIVSVLAVHPRLALNSML